MKNNRTTFFENLSHFSRYYGVQVTTSEQRTSYSTPANWTIGPGGYSSMQQMMESIYKLEVRETSLADIVETIAQLEREKEMRHRIPAINDAWSKYQMLLALYSDYAQ